MQPQPQPKIPSTSQQVFQQNAIALVAGLLFGFGLGLSQMIDRERVLAFLDVTGTWDPTLLFVLAGAVAVTLITFRFILRRPHPLWAQQFYLPTKRSIDVPLVLGSALFGIGWGIAGYCPDPGITALVLGIGNPVLFVIAFIIGSHTYKRYSYRSKQRIG